MNAAVRRSLLSFAAYLVLAAAAVATGRIRPPRPPIAPPAAGAIGLVAGVVLFAVAARGRRPSIDALTARRAAFARLAAYTTIKSACEEIVWRGVLFSILAAVAGTAAALLVSTLAFAAAHAPVQGRRAFATHAATGAVFGGVYLASGSLVAAAAAHAAYNVLGVAARISRRSFTRAAAVRSDSAARLDGVRRLYGTVEALRGIDLTVEPGEIVALLGPNGAGKSTAIEILLGLCAADGGTAAIFGASPRLPRTRELVGVTLQETAFPPLARVRELVELVRAHFPDPCDAADLLRWFGLEEVADRYVSRLSGGERRRLAVALAFAGQPQLVVLDEPTNGLDLESRLAVWTAIRSYSASGGSVLLTTHSVEETEALATRIVVLARGVVVANGTVDQVRGHAGLKRVRLDAERLPRLPGVARQTRDGLRRTLYTADPGSVVTALVQRGVPLRGLEVLPASLEEALLETTRAQP